MGGSGWDDEPRGRGRPSSSRRGFDDDRSSSRSGSRGARGGSSSSRNRDYDDRSRGYDERRSPSPGRGGSSSSRNRGYEDDPPRRSRPRGYDDYDGGPPGRGQRPRGYDDAPPQRGGGGRRGTLPVPPSARDNAPGYGRSRAAAPGRAMDWPASGRAGAGRFGVAVAEDEEDKPSGSGTTVGIVAVGLVIGVVLGVVAGMAYYRSSAPKVPGETPTEQTTPTTKGTPGASPGTTPGATPHAFVPPSADTAVMAYRLVAG